MCIVEGAIKPIFLSAALHDHLRAADLTRSKTLLDIIENDQTASSDSATIYPICLSSIISEEGEDRVHDFFFDVLRPGDGGGAPWAIKHEKVRTLN